MNSKDVEVHLRRRPEVDLTQRHASALAEEVTEAQICRTCVFVSKRMHAVPAVEVLKARRAGISLDELKCEPTKEAGVRNIFADGSAQEVNSDGSVAVKLTKKTERVQGRVETCGQSLQNKCRNCSRLVRETISIIGGTNNNGKPWYREVLVGGHCSIPEEGILVEGEVKRCDPKPMPFREQEQSCFTCGNNQTFGSVWMHEHGQVVAVDLTAYEMERARSTAADGEIGLAIWAARQAKDQVMWPIAPNVDQRSRVAPGLSKFYAADVAETHKKIRTVVIKPAVTRTIHRGSSSEHESSPPWHSAWITYGQYLYGHSNKWFELARMAGFAQGYVGREKPAPETIIEEITPAVTEEREVIVGYTVRFRGSGRVAYFDAACSDDTVGMVHATPNPMRVIIEITSPWHRSYGLPDNDVVSSRVLPHIECPQCHGAVHDRRSSWSEMGCTRCNGFAKVVELPGDEVIRKDISYLVDPFCVERGKAGSDSAAALSGFACRENAPCYFHAKAPRTVETPEGAECLFMGAGNVVQRDSDPRRILSVQDHKVLDANGDAPNPAVFKLRRRSLGRSVDAQFFEQESHLKAGKARRVNLAWGRFMTEEPWKPYCTLNMADPTKGMNFREVMGDWFGDPRAVQSTNPLLDRISPDGMVRNPDGEMAPMTAGSSYFSWSKYMELEDWIRQSNPAERYTEEVVRNDYLIRQARRGRPGGKHSIMPNGLVLDPLAFNRFGHRKEAFEMPEETTVTQLDMHGTDQQMTTREYVNWLNGSCPLHGDMNCEICDEPNSMIAVPIGDNGETMMVTPRWAFYRYEVRGRSASNKKRRVSGMAAEAELVKFNYDSDGVKQDQRLVGFRCTVPEPHPVNPNNPDEIPGFYTADEVNDREHPTCMYPVFVDEENDIVHECGAPLVWDEGEREWEQGHMKMSGSPDPDEPYRRVGGPALAGGPSSRRWLSDDRLLRMGCENWRPKPWIRTRRAATASSRKPVQLGPSTDAPTLVGKTIKVILDGEPLELVVGVDASADAPLVQAIEQSQGDTKITYLGGRGDRYTAELVDIT